MIRLDYVEYDVTHKASFVYDRPEGLDMWLLILTHTPAVFRINGVPVEYPPSRIALFKPGQAIYYGAHKEPYCNDWLRFSTDDTHLIDASIPFGAPFEAPHPAYYHRLFQLLSAEFEHGGEFKEIILDKLMQVMFHKLATTNQARPVTHLSQSIHTLKKEIYEKPHMRWTVKQMANMLNISTGHLETLYKTTFGVTCMEDVIAGRIALAKTYLQCSSHAIAQITQLCGYRSPEHFFRQFKKATGMTPRSYRMSACQMHHPGKDA